MLPLAFNSEGDPFDVPAAAVGWRVKRHQPGRGAPELVYSSAGLPLVIPIEAGIDELHQAVVTPGKYRLDPVDDYERVIKGADAACIVVCERRPEPTTAKPAARAGWTAGMDPSAAGSLRESLRLSAEALRINTEIARKVAGQFGAMIDAAATVLQGADGAALPVREPVHDERTAAADHESEGHKDDHDGEKTEQDERPPTPPSGFDVNALIAHLVSVLFSSRPSGPQSPEPGDAPPAASSPSERPEPGATRPVPPPATQTSAPPTQAAVSPTVGSETRTAPSVVEQPTPPAAASVTTATPPAAPMPSASASIASPSRPSPAVSSSPELPDAGSPLIAPHTTASATSPQREPGAIRNVSAAAVTVRSSPATPCASPRVIWTSPWAAWATKPSAAQAPHVQSPPPPLPIRPRLVAQNDEIVSTFSATYVEPPPLSTDVVLHFGAILRALRRTEAALVCAAAGELSLHDLRAWLEELASMTIEDAIAHMRELIAGTDCSEGRS